MNEENIFAAQIIGVFLSETVKNIAKGSASAVYKQSQLLFQAEIIELGLSEISTSEQIIEKLKSKPETVENINRKLEVFPDLAGEIRRLVDSQTKAEKHINANSYYKDIGTINNKYEGGQHAGTIINNPLSPAVKNKVEVSFRHHLLSVFDEQENYKLQVFVKNLGHKIIPAFTTELRFPRKYLNSSTMRSFEVTGIETDDFALFRIGFGELNALYPEDTTQIIGFDYLITGTVSIDDVVQAKVFIDGEVVRKAEKLMIELINK